MTDYKSTYTDEEIADVVAWFEAHKDKLPKTMKIDDATTSINLAATVEALVYTAQHNHKNANFSGMITQLFNIRNLLETQKEEISSK